MLDFINRREGFYDDARLLILGGQVGEFSLWITSSQVTDIVYVATEGGKPDLVPEVLERLRKLRKIVNIYVVAGVDIDSMLTTLWDDPVSSLLYEAAFQLRADAIITRDAGLRGDGSIAVFDAPGFFKWMEDECGVSYAEIGV